jgi:hypothetical protein
MDHTNSINAQWIGNKAIIKINARNLPHTNESRTERSLMTSIAFIVGLTPLVGAVPPKLAAAASAHPSLSASAVGIFLMLYVVFQTFRERRKKIKVMATCHAS